MLQLHSVFDSRPGAVDFSSGLVTICEGKLHKEFQACTTAGATHESLLITVSLFCPLLDSTTLRFSQQTVEFQAT